MLLCLDYGKRYIGVAITDAENKIALRHSVIDQKEQKAMEVIKNIVEKEMVEKILVSVPLNLLREETDQTQQSLAFIEKLRGLLPRVEVGGVDETFTSVEADRRIKSEGADKDDAHAEAARMMLSDYLKKI
ncbi:MAG: Holliday junction resolvase RuvX [Candidatus Andersenbacteria bacterium]|nr:Holliday junction resolvase RuvX [bacterium]MDZ4225618.1 Holliday junction resolvase RuvX [Candidatus Andersenbacteria bacterium]